MPVLAIETFNFSSPHCCTLAAEHAGSLEMIIPETNVQRYTSFELKVEGEPLEWEGRCQERVGDRLFIAAMKSPGFWVRVEIGHGRHENNEVLSMGRWLLGILVTWVALSGAAPSIGLAQCTGGSVPVGETCGYIGFAGCCQDNQLYFCEGGELCRLSCENMPDCGWDEALGYYECGQEILNDPSGAHPRECPVADNCYGVNYNGCCAGAVVYWCESLGLKTLNCLGNESLTACGVLDNGAVDCVAPGGPAGPLCPFAPSTGDILTPEGEDVAAPELILPDIPEVPEIAQEPDWLSSLDDIEVPDIEAPDVCMNLTERFLVTSSTCEEFGLGFQVKQEGCVAVLVNLVPAASAYAVALVTQMGVSFTIPGAAISKQCAAQLSEGRLTGQCFWGTEKCSFVFAPPDWNAGQDVTEGSDVTTTPVEEGGSSGGCNSVSRSADLWGWVWLLSIPTLLWVLKKRKRAEVAYRC